MPVVVINDVDEGRERGGEIFLFVKELTFAQPRKRIDRALRVVFYRLGKKGQSLVDCSGFIAAEP